MAKFLYLQDFHFSGRTPINRTDNFYPSLLLILDEILSIAKEKKVNFIIDGGDFFNSPIVSTIMVDDVLDRIEETQIRWYVLFGNHCEIGHSIENSKATSLAHMIRRSHFVNYLNTIEDNKYYIKGFEYFHNCEQKIKEEGLFHNKKNKFTIAVVHALIVQKPLPYECMHVVMKNIKTNFDIVISGHNHQGWGIKEIDGIKFINIGCLGRRKIDEKDIEPSCLQIDTETRDLKIIKLKSAKKGSEIFDFKKVEEAKLFEEEINNFIVSLSDVKLQSLNVRGIIEHISQEKRVDKNVVKECISRIGKLET